MTRKMLLTRVVPAVILDLAVANPCDGQGPRRPRPEGSGKKGPDGWGGLHGLKKSAMSNTIRANISADNWLILYGNGRLVAVDPIDFIPHNMVLEEILPEPIRLPGVQPSVEQPNPYLDLS